MYRYAFIPIAVCWLSKTAECSGGANQAEAPRIDNLDVYTPKRKRGMSLYAFPSWCLMNWFCMHRSINCTVPALDLGVC